LTRTASIWPKRFFDVAPASLRIAFCSSRETLAAKPTISSPLTAFGVC
jgi:hypothetical protein